MRLLLILTLLTAPGVAEAAAGLPVRAVGLTIWALVALALVTRRR